MKKTIPTSIAHTLFYIEEDAYARLESYLASIRTYFSNEPKEIVEDIENRIAEKLVEMTGNGTRDRIITDEHITLVMKSLGTPSDFAEEAGTESKQVQETPTRKLYRNKDDAVIGGVASGLAIYFGIEVTLVRLLFIISIFFGGTGILIYIILWIAIPEAKTTAQKLEMRGAPVTLDTMSDVVKEKMREFETRAPEIETAASGFFKKIGHLCKRIVDGIAPAIAKIIGVFFSVIGSVLFVSFLIALIISIVNGPLYLFDAELLTLIPQSLFLFGISAIFLLVAVPALALVSVGTILLGSIRNSGMYLGVLLGIWILALIALSTVAATVSTRFQGPLEAAISSIEQTEERALSPFTKLRVENGQHVTITQGTESRITLRGREADIKATEITTDGEILSIRRSHKEFCLFCFKKRVEIEITTPTLTEAIIKIGSNLTIENFETPSLILTAKTGSHTEVSGTFESLTLSAENGSYIEASGTTKTLTFLGENGSHINAEELLAKEGTVKLSNGSWGSVQVDEKLSGSIKNGSHLSQDGTAEIDIVTTDKSSEITADE